MKTLKRNERGTLMVEVIAVLGLLGVMGTSVFRQVQRRNEELDNINIASEARTIKEATLAFIQANRAEIEAGCTLDEDGYGHFNLDNRRDEIEAFMPDTWASNTGESGASAEDGIIYEYSLYGTCYRIGAGAGDRKGLYATIVPNPDFLPKGFNLKRAGRVANLIGADGGIHAAGEDVLMGANGSWQTDYECPSGSDCNSSWKNEDFFVATTGMDIYIPEVEEAPDNAVIVPRTIAFDRLHSTDYFSVGKGNKNCVNNYDSEHSEYAHQKTTGGSSAVPTGASDEILGVGEHATHQEDASQNCDPLFWVGTWTGDSAKDHSTGGQVYVKNNLYIGQDNASSNTVKHAIAIETGSSNSARQITVHDTTGKNRLTLNADGQIIGRSDGSKGYKLDASSGEIILFDEALVTLDGGTSGMVQVPTMRLKDGVMETNKEYTYSESGASKKEKYRVDPAYTSVMNDIRLSSLGGAKLSDVLPNYIAKSVQSMTAASATKQTVSKPTDCPDGYARALIVTPVSWSQYVKSAELTLNHNTGSGTATAGHTHTFSSSLTGNVDSSGVLEATGSVSGEKLKLTQHKPVQITINSKSNTEWEVGLTYGGTAPTGDSEAITALAQTYCVYNKSKLSAGGEDLGSDTTPYLQEKGNAGTAAPSSKRECSDDVDCANVEYCDTVVHQCVKYGTCTGSGEMDGKDDVYCVAGQYAYIQCLTDSMCDSSKEICQNNRCRAK